MAALQDYLVLLNPRDNVAVAKRPIPSGTAFADAAPPLVSVDSIPFGHKMALQAMEPQQPAIKYGQIIGFASQPIAPGQHVHTHNLVMHEYERAYEFGPDIVQPGPAASEHAPHFQGYLRPDGRVGTRNYLAVISNVNCSASVARYVAEHFRRSSFQREFPHVDGIVAFTHKSGCGIQPGEPLQLLQRVLTGMALHPNVSGAVLIGLGCEVNQLSSLLEAYRLRTHSSDPSGPGLLAIQELGGVRKTVEAGIAAVTKLLPLANARQRTSVPISQLVLATNCGGSDGNSGITANPALGVASDALVSFGGTSVLAETPEIYGAEHLLVRRAIRREVAEKLLDRIRWWEAHVRLFQATIDNNPAVGNKEGGLTTIFEKSLGAIAKGGQSPLVEVYRYAEPITAKGFCFMDTPGFDPVSMTGLVAGGCTVGVLTTGRGSVYGCKPCPCIKVATNTPLYERMAEDMDINAGTILEGKETVAQVGQRIFDKLLAVANGEKTRSEQSGLGDEEFAPWILGPTF